MNFHIKTTWNMESRTCRAMGVYKSQPRSEGKCWFQTGKGMMLPVRLATTPAVPKAGKWASFLGSERWWTMPRVKETLLEDSSDSDKQNDHQIWVQG